MLEYERLEACGVIFIIYQVQISDRCVMFRDICSSDDAVHRECLNCNSQWILPSADRTLQCVG